MKVFRVEEIVSGECSGEPIVVDRKISFYGEVDPEKGVVRGEDIVLKDKVLVLRGTRGSTVGSYILYALKYYGVAPKCIIAGEVEPILVIGCIIANIPLFKVVDYSGFIEYLRLVKNPYISYSSSEKTVVVYGEERINDSN